ncbi:MAG: hypothetical protein H6656_05870 [Ardenticatenaceae bacterium]|nr:hypothetical protein [Ardenticatenaceae bacterium]
MTDQQNDPYRAYTCLVKVSGIDGQFYSFTGAQQICQSRDGSADANPARPWIAIDPGNESDAHHT